MPQLPRVTAVVPTRHRPAEVVRAVRSALAQTVPDLEVVVVVDGADPATRAALEAVGDPRLRILELGKSGGANAARNAGAESAATDWVAFLDDDDEWHSRKLELQLARAAERDRPEIVACRMESRRRGSNEILPRRLPAPDEPISDYLFVRRGWRKREGIFQTSMILARTELLRNLPFRADIAQNQETDWILRATAAGARLAFREEALGVWNNEGARARLTDEIEWRGAVDWIRSVRHLVTPTAYAAFLLIWATDAAANGGQRGAFRQLRREAFRDGAPRAKDLLFHLWLTGVPRSLRRRLRR